MSLFTLRGPLQKRQRILLEIAGFFVLILIWFVFTVGENPILHNSILPSPLKVLSSYSELYSDNDLIKNTCRSLGLNLAGYFEAIAIALPVGFIIGLFPLFRGAFQRQVDAFRYVPLTAVTGLFIIWFGLGIPMKTHFLAFGILIYLLPIVVQRIDEVNDVYLKTVFTLGASSWQTIKTVYIPSVISRLSDDIRVLTAISWTYIIIAESLGNEGGIGALIWRVGQRQGRVDKVFALLIVIIVIGIMQDKLFTYLDREFFPHKYQNKARYSKSQNKEKSTLDAVLNYSVNTIVWVGLAIYIFLFINEYVPLLGNAQPLTYLFGDTVYVIHLLAFGILGYKGYYGYQKLLKRKIA
ncbi:MAG: ABC transporter permease subunit [Bacteroidetes bacterium]|nr:ABC transporter permease subunit [Bacteroidota bacterium]